MKKINKRKNERETITGKRGREGQEMKEKKRKKDEKK